MYKRQEQWIVGSARDRPAIQPRVTIVDTPEGNTTDYILVTLYNLKEIEITLIEEFLRLLVKSLHVWIVLLPVSYTHLDVYKRQGIGRT